MFQRLGKQLKLLTVIELQYVSPRLLNVRDLDIAVPGEVALGGRSVKLTLQAHT